MKLIAYRSSRSGGMNGGFSSTSIVYTEDGRCRVTFSDKAFHNQPIKHTEYYADGLLEKLSEVCERYNVISWTDLPGEKFNMLDGDSGSNTFTFENGAKIVLESGKIYPEFVRAMFLEFNEQLEASKNYAVDMVEFLEEEAPFAMGMMGMMGALNAKPVKVQVTTSQSEDTSKWAKVCPQCGAKFTGNQKFCPECGAVRPKE